MRVLFWVPYPTEGPSNRYRIEQYLPYLKAANIKYSLRPFWSASAYRILYKPRNYFKKACFFIFGTLSRMFDIMRIMQFNIVFIHRESYPVGGAFFETILSVFNKPFIFDFDDAIFLPVTSRFNYYIEKLKKSAKTKEIVRMSSYVIAGNSYLSDFASRYSSRVSIIPTVIDTQVYKPLPKDCASEIIVGWIGSSTTIDFLLSMRSVFIHLSGKYPYLKFKIIGGDLFIDGINVICKPWSLAEELEELRSFDIGIMPLPNNEWSKGKCGFKAILYMSMGIPVICSPVGVNKEIIQDGENGFLAKDESEWVEKLSLLIENLQLRQKMGLAGRKTIEEKYSVKVNAPKFLDVIQKVYTKMGFNKSP